MRVRPCSQQISLRDEQAGKRSRDNSQQLETAKISADIRATIVSLRAQQKEMQKIHEENVRATKDGVLACSFAHTMRCVSWPDST